MLPCGPAVTEVERVEVGRVIKPHGLRGEVAVFPTSEVMDRLSAGTAVWVDGVATTVATSRPHQGRPLVRFEHVRDRSAAELLRGALVEAAPLDPEELDTYLISELIGVPVIDAIGGELGRVIGVIEMPAVAGYDLLEVERPTGGTWLLPAADELVEAVDDAEGLRLMVRELPEGLLDAGAATTDRRTDPAEEDT
jgi:16S rRNA processing protein RimM